MYVYCLVPENKLFIGMLSRKAGEAEVRELFGPFGDIREIYMIRNADGSSKCAAFLRYVKREAALQAIENLHNNLVMDGSARPLSVKFADNKHQRQQRYMRNVRRQGLLHAMGAGPAYPGYQVPPPMAMPRITEALNILFRLNTQLMVPDSLHRRMVIHTLLHLILTCILHINMDLNRLMAFKLDKMAFNPDKTQGLLILDRVRVPLELICLCITCHMI